MYDFVWMHVRSGIVMLVPYFCVYMHVHVHVQMYATSWYTYEQHVHT